MEIKTWPREPVLSCLIQDALNVSPDLMLLHVC